MRNLILYFLKKLHMLCFTYDRFIMWKTYLHIKRKGFEGSVRAFMEVPVVNGNYFVEVITTDGKSSDFTKEYLDLLSRKCLKVFLISENRLNFLIFESSIGWRSIFTSYSIVRGGS